MNEMSDKLLARGVASLSDRELLMILLSDMANAQECVDSILAKYSFSTLVDVDIQRLRMVEGIGLKRAQRVVVAAQIGRRMTLSANELQRISSSRDVVDYFRPKLELLNHEECWVLYLTSSNGVIESQRVSLGGVSATIVDHRLIIKRALELLCTQIIIIHNHPSGVSDPSQDDIDLTKKIKQAADLFDIKLLDHIIISRGADYSFRSSKLL